MPYALTVALMLPLLKGHPLQTVRPRSVVIVEPLVEVVLVAGEVLPRVVHVDLVLVRLIPRRARIELGTGRICPTFYHCLFSLLRFLYSRLRSLVHFRQYLRP